MAFRVVRNAADRVPPSRVRKGTGPTFSTSLAGDG
jgi:hypothetical protein